jgi:hypothetical protein
MPKGLGQKKGILVRRVSKKRTHDGISSSRLAVTQERGGLAVRPRKRAYFSLHNIVKKQQREFTSMYYLVLRTP